MCVLSMVHDYYRPIFPNPWEPIPPDKPLDVFKPLTPEELAKAIEDFQEAVKAAKVVDDLTGQKDCEDPEKTKLVERVAELERRLDEYEQSEQRRAREKKPRKKPGKSRRR